MFVVMGNNPKISKQETKHHEFFTLNLFRWITWISMHLKIVCITLHLYSTILIVHFTFTLSPILFLFLSN